MREVYWRILCELEVKEFIGRRGEDEEGTLEDKLDIRLSLPCVTFVIHSQIRKDEYSALLASDDVDYSASKQLKTDAKLKTILTMIARKAHFSIVEETTKAASLFGKNIGGAPICMLVKKTADGIQIDGKAGEEQLIQSIVQDVSEICAKL